MKLTISRLPLIAKNLYPSLDELHEGYKWYLDANQVVRERYNKARLDLIVKNVKLDAPAKEIYSSGSTGIRKRYLWGPGFITMDKFFHDLVKDGDRLKRLVHVHLNKLTYTGEPNKVDLVQLDDNSYNIQKHVILSINGQGDIEGLKEEIDGWNLFVSTSSFMILEKLTNFVELIDRESLVIFTGEALPQEMRERLRYKGIDVRDEMRCWDGGATFYTCRYGKKHWVDYLAKTWIEEGKLYSSDFYNACQPHIDYCNGDILTRSYGETCQCGQIVTETEFVNRAASTIFRSPLGNSLTYELIYALFLKVTKITPEQLHFLAIGKYKTDIDTHLKLHYLADAISEESLVSEFYATFGIKIEPHRYVEGSVYKIKKVYWVNDDQSHDSQAGNNS